MKPHQNRSIEIVNSMEWVNNHLRIVDQTLLPVREEYLELEDELQVRHAICSLQIRGAPAIGIAALYGMYLGVRRSSDTDRSLFLRDWNRVSESLLSSRPTAVNLQWAIDQAQQLYQELSIEPIPQFKSKLLNLACKLHEEDKRNCARIGEYGQAILGKNTHILTHCNTGSLATGKYGTALSVIYHAHLQGKKIHVWVDETRPLLQGSRLTAWELQKTGIPHTLITDSTAGWVMKTQKVDAVLAGADRVARNGDTANKIGTYSLAILAREHRIPFYIALPTSTLDLSLENGHQIPIEERSASEVRHTGTCPTAPHSTPVFNPAFDITPHHYITAFITEKGIVRPDFTENLAKIATGRQQGIKRHIRE